MSDPRPIGVFDSGIGGITVLKALRARLPHEDLVYLGDTARLPYGTKSAETVTAYATQATRHLLGHDIKMAVIACNTATSVALGPLSVALAPLPVIGVVGPGAEAGVKASRTRHIAVIATEATVRGGAYPRAIHALDPGAHVVQEPCGIFVALAEEGWVSGDVVEAAARRYLEPIFAHPNPPDTLVLGCTHFPVLAGTIGKVAGPNVTLVDSAETTARAVETELSARDLASPRKTRGRTRFLATDSPERFARVGGIFFGEPIVAGEVELVDIRPA
ncbi:MAG: glutamate racemase [Parvibaculum sp.]|uniref:glutamate racemase n=1 Tax=Parvibaculum sp. TaxID=2024848 RepID=UPI003C789205